MIINKKIYKLNPEASIERIYSIAEKTNNYVESGEVCSLCLGHSSSDDPDQIGIVVGNATNFQVIGDGIYADLNVDDKWVEFLTDGHWNKVSCELWCDDVVSSIALLSHNRPNLELGVIKYQMPDRGIEHKQYTLENEDILNMDIAELKQLLVETLNGSEYVAKLNALLENIVPSMQEQMKSIQDTLAPLLAVEEEEHAELEANEATEETKEELVAEDAAQEGKEHPELPKEEIEQIAEDHVEEGKVDEVEKNDMAAGASANNTYIAGIEEDDKKKKVDKYQMQKELSDALQEKLLKAEQEKMALIDELETQKQELLVKYQMERRKNDLLELAKTHNFDAKEELNLVQHMDDKQFENHKKIILTKYQRAPIGRKVSVGVEIEKDDMVVRADKANKAREVALKENISFAEALKKV